MKKILLALVFVCGCKTTVYQPVYNPDYGPGLPGSNVIILEKPVIILGNPVEEPRIITIISVTPVPVYPMPPIEMHFLPSSVPDYSNNLYELEKRK